MLFGFEVYSIAFIQQVFLRMLSCSKCICEYNINKPCILIHGKRDKTYSRVNIYVQK